MLENPQFLQGIYPFSGQGLDKPVPFDPPVTYTVPTDKRSQLIYFRAGNSSPEMIYVVLNRNGKPMRYFPIEAKGASHVPLAVVQDLFPDDVIDLGVAAPEHMDGIVVLDVGLVEI